MANSYFYSDFDIEFELQSNGDIILLTDLDSIFNSIKNLVLTNKGERRMLPSYGSNIQKLLFEPLDEITARRIGEELVSELKVWEDRITISSMDVEILYDENSYKMRLNFYISESLNQEIQTISFILNRN
jgi:phage baseplate assembly protein W